MTQAAEKLGPPTLRLAAFGALFGPAPGGARRYPNRRDKIDSGPLLYPGLLISFVYLRHWLNGQHLYAYRDWALDSGAFSARSRGIRIELAEYIDVAKRILAVDPTLVDVFALDVIGDWRASIKNAEAMWAAGVKAVPAFHRHEPWAQLEALARDYPKIAIGGMADLRGEAKYEYVAACFSRIWRAAGPTRVHGFGTATERMLMAYPWHSVDATSWEAGPCRSGNWRAFGKMSLRGSSQNLRAEFNYYLSLEARAREKWRPVMEAIEARRAINEATPQP